MKKSRAPRRKRKHKSRADRAKSGWAGSGRKGERTVASQLPPVAEPLVAESQLPVPSERVIDKKGFVNGDREERAEKKAEKGARPTARPIRVSSTAAESASGSSSRFSFIGWPVRVVGRWFEFIRQVRAETVRVIWPSRNETLVTTIMVFIIVALAALFFLAADQLLSFSVAWIFRNLSL